MELPSISIITLTYNPDPHIFRKSLESIRMQHYPKQKIEQIVMDGGSTNGAMGLAKEFGCKTFVMPRLRENGEGRKGIGITRAKHELIAFIESDNILVGNDWFMRMVEPFINDKRITGTFSMHNAYAKGMPALTRYCALIGINDPTVYYLGKSEKMPRFTKTYDKGIRIEDTKGYTTIRFTADTLPTLGDNGHMVRRTSINKINSEPENFLHTDAFFRLAELGFDTYGVVKNTIIHYTGSSIISLYKRRVTFKRQFFDSNEKNRSYHVFDRNNISDRWHLLFFIVYSMTFVQPFLFSMKGYFAVRDRAWFLHPVVCWVAACSYGIHELLSRLHDYDR